MRSWIRVVSHRTFAVAALVAAALCAPAVAQDAVPLDLFSDQPELTDHADADPGPGS